MIKIMIAAMPGDMPAARKLETETGFPLSEIVIHHFPDGESLVRVPPPAETAIIYCTLDHPNEKLIELGLAASALKNLGARRLVLVAPYLGYMRQDKAFHEGEAVAQRFVGALLAQWFDRIVTVEPHLHRTKTLVETMPGIEAAALSAADLLAEMICKDGASSGVLLAAPDEEAQAWTALVAQAVGAPFITLQKTRTGDRDVVISVRDDSSIAGKTVYLVDDIVSTGQTLATAAQLLKSKGAARVEAVIVHALFNEADLKRMKESGVDSVRSTNSITHDSNAISIAPLLAAALNQERR